MKQLKIDLSVPIEGGPLDGHAVAYDHDVHPEPLPSIAPTGLIPSRGIILPVALPAGYEDASVYRLLWIGEHHDEPVYRWCATKRTEDDTSKDEVRRDLVEALGVAPDTTLDYALEIVYELAECPGGPRHQAQNVDGYCSRCGHYFPDDDCPSYVPATLAEAIKRTLPYRAREADQSVFNRHQPINRAVTEVSSTKVCGTCYGGSGDPVTAPCADLVDLARRYGFDPEGLVS